MSTPSKYSPRTNTKVLQESGYQFKPDTYKPRVYIRLDSGWLRAKQETSG